jgi:LruC domain-containing protein
MKSLIIKIASLSIMILVSVSCLKDEEIVDQPTAKKMNDLQISASFKFKTTKELNLNLQTKTNTGAALSKIRIDLFDSDPSLDENGQTAAVLLFSGFTDANGTLSGKLIVPDDLESVYASPRYIGLPQAIKLDATSNIICTFGGASGSRNNRSVFSVDQTGYFTLGTWSTTGLPTYLEPIPDVIEQGLLEDLNASLPESVYGGIPVSHPEFLSSETNIDIKENAEVWITFVHEGAGFKNVLGYFTYPTGTPPTSVSQINDLSIAFPNSSYAGSGGDLHSGDKVKLRYFNPSTQALQDEFPAGTSVAWFIVASGFSSGIVSTTAQKYYSIKSFNPETNPANLQHNVLLYDAARNLVLIGFEDLNRNSGSDNDFNDAVFYATSYPESAIETINMEEVVSESPDTDGDEINNNADDYPDDPNKAFDNYYPNSLMFGTLAFEDLYPYTGDYDFNDLVIDYQYKSICNPNNEVLELEVKLVVRAIGASYSNGFGFEMPILPAMVQSVSGNLIRENYITLSANGTEAEQTKAVIIAFDNAFRALPHPGGSIGINTIIGSTYVQPDTLTINIVFTSPISMSELGVGSLFNPFMIITQNRAIEVHLPDMAPTDLCPITINATGNRFFTNERNLPWAIDLPYPFAYPTEKSPVIDAHTKFATWAESSGNSYKDWYKNVSGYRVAGKIYEH